MNWKIPVIFLILFAVFFAVHLLFWDDIVVFVQSLLKLNPTILALISIITAPILTVWNTIPQAIQGMILAAIPTLTMGGFLAWTKNRAMKKLQQTEEQAKAQATQLIGEKTEAQQEVKAKLEQLGAKDTIIQLRDEKIAELETQIANSPSLAEIQRLKDTNEKLQQDFNSMEKYYQNEIDRVRLKVHETTVVK